MNTRKLLNIALEGVDTLGYRLDQLGITSRVNRHNIAAFLMAEQKNLEGEWDSIQAKVDRRRSQFEHLTQRVEDQAETVLAPLVARVGRFRASQ